jgi:Holliday junction resolvase RusA-like endonuclease
MESYEVTLPLPPSVNVMYRSVYRSGRIRVVVSKAGRAFRHACYPLLKDYRKPFTGEIALSCVFYFKTKRSDLDNRLKALLDVLETNEFGFGLFDNDIQIMELHAFKEYDPKNPRVHVVVTELLSKEDQV